MACRTTGGKDLVVYTGEDHTFPGQFVAECRNEKIAAGMAAWWNGDDPPELEPAERLPTYVEVVDEYSESTGESNGNQ